MSDGSLFARCSRNRVQNRGNDASVLDDGNEFVGESVEQFETQRTDGLIDECADEERDENDGTDSNALAQKPSNINRIVFHMIR